MLTTPKPEEETSMTTKTAYDYHYRWEPRSSRKRLGTALATALCAACLSLAGLMLLPGLLGYQRYVITSGSMTGTYDRGSVVFDKVVPVSDLRVGDAITYMPPPGSGPSGRITHRIVWIGSDQVRAPGPSHEGRRERGGRSMDLHARRSHTGSRRFPCPLRRLRALRPGDPPGADGGHRSAGTPDRLRSARRLPPRRAQGDD